MTKKGYLPENQQDKNRKKIHKILFGVVYAFTSSSNKV